MAQAERTTVTGEQILPSEVDGGASLSILEFPTGRGLVTGTSGVGKSDTADVEKPPERVEAAPEGL
jgi:hypothetical protein